jgi:hypothetical protein
MSYNRRKRVDPSVNRSKKYAPPRLGVAISGSKPLESVGLGCHPTQVQEFNQYYQQHGITGAHHNEKGNCVLESRKARNQVLKLRGLRDNDAGYGDWSGIN